MNNLQKKARHVFDVLCLDENCSSLLHNQFHTVFFILSFFQMIIFSCHLRTNLFSSLVQRY